VDRPSRGARGARPDRRLRLRLSQGFILEGHRGARDLFADNTIDGFLGAEPDGDPAGLDAKLGTGPPRRTTWRA
jgi:hypothetical protein